MLNRVRHHGKCSVLHYIGAYFSIQLNLRLLAMKANRNDRESDLCFDRWIAGGFCVKLDESIGLVGIVTVRYRGISFLSTWSFSKAIFSNPQTLEMLSTSMSRRKWGCCSQFTTFDMYSKMSTTRKKTREKFRGRHLWKMTFHVITFPPKFKPLAFR